MTLNAAYPQALSSTAATAPAWRKPCCWVNLASYGIASSTRPRSTETSSAPSVVIITCRAKLARTRARITAAGSASAPLLDSGTGQSSQRELPVALLHTQLAVGIVGGCWVARRVQRGDLVSGERQAGRAKVGVKLLDRACTEDGRGHRRPAGHPRQGDLGHAHAAFARQLLYRVNDLPGARRAAPVVGLHAAARVLAQAGGTGRALAALVLARQPAATERAPGQQPHARVHRGGHDLPLDLADEQAVLRLQRDRRSDVQRPGQVHRLGQLPPGEVGQPVIADLARADEAIQRAQRLLHRRQRVKRMEL